MRVTDLTDGDGQRYAQVKWDGGQVYVELERGVLTHEEAYDLGWTLCTPQRLIEEDEELYGE